MRNVVLFLMLLHAGIGNANDQLTSTSPCPGLVSSYNVEKFEQVLVVTDTEFASIEDCSRLGGFFFGASSGDELALDYSRLAAIVGETWQPVSEDAPQLILEAVLSWLKGLGFEQYAESFRHFVDAYLPAEQSVRLFFTLVVSLIVLAVVTLVLYEFYRAGLLQLPQRRRRAAHRQRQRNEPGITLDAVLTLPWRMQISALLQYSIDQLAAARLIPFSSSLTNRELIACLEKSDARKASLLRDQIERTEPVVYGDAAVSEDQLFACRALAEELACNTNPRVAL